MAIHVGRPDLVVRGPYRVFRHPMYSGLLLVGCGLVLNHVVAWRWGTLIILVAVLDIKAPSCFSVRSCGKTLVSKTQGTKVASEEKHK